MNNDDLMDTMAGKLYEYDIKTHISDIMQKMTDMVDAYGDFPFHGAPTGQKTKLMKEYKQLEFEYGYITDTAHQLRRCAEKMKTDGDLSGFDISSIRFTKP